MGNDGSSTQKGPGANAAAAAAADASKYYERLVELPNIKEAVNDLPLIDFEKKDEEGDVLSKIEEMEIHSNPAFRTAWVRA